MHNYIENVDARGIPKAIERRVLSTLLDSACNVYVVYIETAPGYNRRFVHIPNKVYNLIMLKSINRLEWEGREMWNRLYGLGVITEFLMNIEFGTRIIILIIFVILLLLL